MTSPMTAQGRQQNAQSYAQQIAQFNRLTRNRNYTLPGFTRSATTLRARFDLPPSNLLARIKIEVRGTVNAAPGTTPDSAGLSKIIKQVQVVTNMGDDLVNLSGPQYFGLQAPYIDFIGNAIPHSTGWTAIANGASVILPIVIPFAVNLRDATGLIPLQNRQTVATLWVEFDTDANLGSGSAITWTTQPVITPYFEVFTIPFEITAQPPISMLHRIIGTNVQVSGAGDFANIWDRGTVVLQKFYGLGYQVTTPADHFTQARLISQQTDTLYNNTPNSLDTYVGFQRPGVTRRAGVVPFDFIGQSGLGNYDIPRDAVDMRVYTDMQAHIQASGGSYPETCDIVTRYLQPI